MGRRAAGGSDAQKVCEACSCFDRDRCCRIADLCRSLGCARDDRILIMRDEDQATRALLTLICLLVVIPWIIATIARISVQELRHGYASCRARLKSLTGSLKATR